MPDAAVSNENHLLARVDERVKAVAKEQHLLRSDIRDWRAEDQEWRADHDKRIRKNREDITTHKERLSNMTKIFGVVELGIVGILAYLGLRPGP